MQTKISSSNEKLDSESGLVVERRFTSAGQDPFDSFEWITMDVEIRNPDGSMADSIEGVALPSGFSGVPGKVCAQKYLRKAGVPKYLRNVPEEGVPVWLQRRSQITSGFRKLMSPIEWVVIPTEAIIPSTCRTWTYWGWKYGYFASEADARAYFDEMKDR